MDYYNKNQINTFDDEVQIETLILIDSGCEFRIFVNGKTNFPSI